FGIGRVAQGFVFVGNGDGVSVGNPVNLRLQNFTIEAWLKRASGSVISTSGSGDAEILSYGFGGYAFGMNDNGTIYLSQAGSSSVSPSTAITDTNFHHVAVTKTGSTVVFYFDGAAYAVPAYGPTFTFSSSAMIGVFPANLAESFFGTI